MSTESGISPTGLGLHWPQLDADVDVPALLQGVFGSKRCQRAKRIAGSRCWPASCQSCSMTWAWSQPMPPLAREHIRES
ncbi:MULTISPECIES: DUF2442 domain-containing protein [unclassified Mesorhizobium]|uniref:DUF2442 domain-containing protein n=1 Tax=unclassified Mesorhizobium TaxID=325217 RepID=UPI0033390EA4